MDLTNLNIEKEIYLGEDSTRQFKERLDSAAKLAEEMCALSNSHGGVIYVGVKDDNTIAGISQQEMGQYNQWIFNASNENIKPAIYPETRIVDVGGNYYY